MTFFIMLAIGLGLVTFEVPSWCFTVYTAVAFILSWLYIRKINRPA